MGWLQGWMYRKSHVINSAPGAGTGYQVKIIAYYGSGTDSDNTVYLNSRCKTDFSDVRFTASDGVTLLPYWTESVTASSVATFWVKITDDLSSASSTIYLYFGNPNATSASSGANTFLYYDDFESGIDWTVVQGYGTNTVDTTTVKQGTYSHKLFGVNSLPYTKAQKTLPSAIPAPFAIEVWERNTNATYSDGYMFYEFFQSNGSTGMDLFTRRDDAGRYKPEFYVTGGSLITGLGIDNYDYNYWHFLRILVLSSSQLKFNWIYNGVTDEGTYGPYSPSISEVKYIGFSCGNSDKGQGWQDVIRIRKYVEPEPTHGAWGATEIQPLTLVDTVKICDCTIKFAGKTLSDTVSLKDSKIVGRILTDTVSLSDSVKKAVTKLLTDTISLKDRVYPISKNIGAARYGLATYGVSKYTSRGERTIEMGKITGATYGSAVYGYDKYSYRGGRQQRFPKEHEDKR